MRHSRETNEHYRRLAFELGDGDRGRMLSGWQCENPFVDDLIKEVRARSAAVDFREYVYFDADEALAEKVLTLHAGLDGMRAPAALAGAGASPLISAFVAWVAESGIKTVHYIPPLYHTIPSGFARYGIELVPAARLHAYEPSFELDLPPSRSLLLLTDPVWYAGCAVSHGAMEEIRQWQARTDSFVFVDGSLQYLAWDGNETEASSGLLPELTFRLISPCKQLAVNGYRFAYLLLPAQAEPSLAWTYANLCGPASAESVVFAHVALEAVLSRSIPSALTARASERFRALVRADQIEVGPWPDRGYYAFVRLLSDGGSCGPSMDGRYFEQSHYPGFTKINLLSPAYDTHFSGHE